jgi:outer membrane receptor protein involved in Fe transport
MKTIILTILVLVGSSNLYSIEETVPQPKGKGEIKGRIVDQNLKRPIEYTNVVLYKSGDSSMVTGTITNENGEFVISNLDYGKYYLTANFIGYRKVFVNDIELSGKKKAWSIETLALQPASQNLEDVEVIVDKNYIDYKIDKKVVNVSQHVNAAGGTAAEVLENVPGVQVDIEGNVTIRGSSNYMVLIDGRPSVIAGPDLLKQLPANTVENIEIITNPSAKYDPDGTAGIVNVIMKKEKLEGMNGMVNLIAGTNGKYGSDFNLNIKRRKINLFVGGNYNMNSFLSETTNHRESYLSDTVSFLTEITDRTQINNPWKFTSGLDLLLSNKTSLTISGAIGGFGMYRDFDTRYHEYDTVTGINKYSHSVNIYEIDGVYYTGSVSIHHQFAKEGHYIDASVTAWNWDSDNTQDTRETETDANNTELENPKRLRTLDQVYRENLQAKIDYTLPIGDGKLEAGCNIHISPGNSDFTFENFDNELEDWTNNPLFSNLMNFQRDIFSSYTTYGNQILGFQYQVGLRLEYTDRKLEQLTMEKSWPVEIFNYYPSVHISRQLKKNQQIQLSYSRRIDRPQAWDFNPFPSYNDAYNSFTGNPLLKPADTDSYEFSYIKRVKSGLISATAFYRQNRNTKVMAIDNTDNHLMVITWENLGEINARGVEAMTNLELKKWWTLNIGGNLYFLEMEGQLLGNDLKQESLSADARISSTFKFGPNTRLQATAYYQSAKAEGQGMKEDDFITSFALRHDFLKRRASLSISIRDPFGTHYYKVSTRTDTFYSDFKMDGESAAVRVTLSYRLNDYQRRRDQTNIEVGGGM